MNLIIAHISIVIVSGVLLLWASSKLVEGITNVARYLRWLEFVIAFFVMALASSIPNLFVGITSALYNIPQLSFGDVVGNSIVDLTLVVALAVLFGKELQARHPLIQISSILTIFIAILPMLLILDGTLGVLDGLLLISVFVVYSVWLFSKRHTYEKVFNHVEEKDPIVHFQTFLSGFGKILLGVILILIAAQGIVLSAQFFAASFKIPVALIGILVLGIGNAIPEIYFAIAAAKRGKHLMILGELMGSVIVLTTLVLGIVAILNPIEIDDFSQNILINLTELSRGFIIMIYRSFQRFTQRRHKLFI